MNDAQEQLRQAIRRRLESDEAMQEHFGVYAHADWVATTVMELFPYVRESEWLSPGFVVADVRKRPARDPRAWELATAGMSEDERAQVSRLWAKDWDSPEDSADDARGET